MFIDTHLAHCLHWRSVAAAYGLVSQIRFFSERYLFFAMPAAISPEGRVTFYRDKK
jgi:hypothetical protein